MYLIVCLRRQCGFPEEGHALCLHDIVLAQGQPHASCVLLYTVDYLLMQNQVLPRGLLTGTQRYQIPQLLNFNQSGRVPHRGSVYWNFGVGMGVENQLALCRLQPSVCWPLSLRCSEKPCKQGLRAISGKNMEFGPDRVGFSLFTCWLAWL